VISGRMAQYVRTEFKVIPSLHWDEQWNSLAQSVFATPPA
jgi:hypothetical protein